MAYGMHPLERDAVGRGKDVIYVKNPSVGNANGTNAKSGIGFPESAIFTFEDGLYGRLCAAHDANDKTALMALWKEAKPLTSKEKSEIERSGARR
jgi:hypothetical protein